MLRFGFPADKPLQGRNALPDEEPPPRQVEGLLAQLPQELGERARVALVAVGAPARLEPLLQRN